MNTVRLSTELRDKVRQVAEQRGVSVSEVHREALERFCATEILESQISRFDDVIGICDGAPPDLSETIGSRYSAEMAQKYARNAD